MKIRTIIDIVVVVLFVCAIATLVWGQELVKHQPEVRSWTTEKMVKWEGTVPKETAEQIRLKVEMNRLLVSLINDDYHSTLSVNRKDQIKRIQKLAKQLK